MECPRFDIERYNARSTAFTELLSEWMLPLYESSIILDMAVGEGRFFTFLSKPRTLILVKFGKILI